MLRDERGPDAVDREDFGHRRCIELPKTLFWADIRSAMQEPGRHDQQVESTLLGNLTSCLGKHVVVEYVDRQPGHIGMARRMGPPVPGIDAVKLARCDKLLDKRSADASTASDHQGALAVQMPLLTATKPARFPEALIGGVSISHMPQREGGAVPRSRPRPRAGLHRPWSRRRAHEVEQRGASLSSAPTAKA